MRVPEITPRNYSPVHATAALRHQRGGLASHSISPSILRLSLPAFVTLEEFRAGEMAELQNSRTITVRLAILVRRVYRETAAERPRYKYSFAKDDKRSAPFRTILMA